MLNKEKRLINGPAIAVTAMAALVAGIFADHAARFTIIWINAVTPALIGILMAFSWVPLLGPVLRENQDWLFSNLSMLAAGGFIGYISCYLSVFISKRSYRSANAYYLLLSSFIVYVPLTFYWNALNVSIYRTAGFIACALLILSKLLFTKSTETSQRNETTNHTMDDTKTESAPAAISIPPPPPPPKMQ